MPHRRIAKNFRERYDELEDRRVELVERLSSLGDRARRHPGYKHAMILLNSKFRKSRLAQRLAVLEAAAFLIEVLERLMLAG